MQIGVGDRFTLVGSDVHKQNRQRSVTVVGIYDIGVRDTEKKTLYISLAGGAGPVRAAGSIHRDRHQPEADWGPEPAVVAALAGRPSGI